MTLKYFFKNVEKESEKEIGTTKVSAATIQTDIILPSVSKVKPNTRNTLDDLASKKTSLSVGVFHKKKAYDYLTLVEKYNITF